MESNTLNDPTSKLNKYVTESFKGFFHYQQAKTSGVYFKKKCFLKIILSIFLINLSFIY